MSERRVHPWCAPVVLALLVLPALPASPASAAADGLSASRRCRTAIARQAAGVTALGFQLLDVCHVRRGAGKRADACLPFSASDPKGRLAAARDRARAAIDRACAADDVVRGNFPGGLVATALLSHLESTLAESARALQGSPVLAGDRQARKCHAAIGAARSAIVKTIVTRAVRCQKARDRKATVFGDIADACLKDAGKTATRAAARVARSCRRKGGPALTGVDVGSCDPLPACVIDAATATGTRIARAAYARPHACGDDIRGAGEVCPALEGPPDEPALAAIVTMDVEPGVPPAEIAEAPTGARVARTRIEVELAPAATVGDVNALLAALDAEIVMAVANAPLLLLRIPDPGSVPALEAVLASARAHPAVHRATAGYFAEPDLLPDNFDRDQAGGADLSKIDHLLAVRAPAAWNARGALPPVAERPTVVVGDLFGDGPPDAVVDVAGIVAGDFATGVLDPTGHGYHVLGIVAAALGGPACTPPSPASAAVGRGCATGMFPGTLPVRAVDLQYGLTTLGEMMRMVQTLLFAGDRAILSTSLNHCGAGTCGDPLVAAQYGANWVRLVRASGLEDDVLHLTSAGNIHPTTPALIAALTNSGFTAAALFEGGLFDAFGSVLSPLGNVLVVENAKNTAAEPYGPLCLHDSSKRGGHLTGVGTAVWSLRDAAGTASCGFAGRCGQDASTTHPTACTVGNSTPCQAANKTGTSMATPQVAALAAYLWALAPTITVAELRSALLATAVPTGNAGGAGDCDAAAPKPVIDAYAAVLALDGTATPPSPASAPMRHALLDADGDGVFDQTDLGLFLERYLEGFVDAGSHGPPVAPATRDYGRFDLNGDGFTGGPGTAPFDLDRVGSPPFAAPALGRVFQELDEGGGVFFEAAGVTDLEIVCYYAHSDLYGGTPAARLALVDRTWCNAVEVEASFVGFEEDDLEAGEPALLRVRVLYRDATGAEQPLPDVRVEITADGGSGSGNGTTDATGVVERNVTPGQGSEEVEVTVRVRPAGGGMLLAETTLRAGVDEEDDDEHEECGDDRPDGVYLEKRSSIAYGNAVAYYVQESGTGRDLYRQESADQLRKRNDLPGAPFDRYFASWSGSASGGGSRSLGGVTSSGSYVAGQTSEMQGQSVVVDDGEGGEREVFVFEGFTFTALAQTLVSHANSGALRAESSSVAVGATCVEFSVVGAPAGYAFASALGAGTYIEFSGDPCSDDHADFYHYYINEVAPYPPGTFEDDLPRGGLLQPGYYDLCVTLGARSRIGTNQPAGAQPDDPSNKNRLLELTFTVQ